MTNEIIIEKLKKLIVRWDKSAKSKERTAYTLYCRESMEYQALQLASNTQINCILDINSFIEELEEKDKKEEGNEAICKCGNVIIKGKGIFESSEAGKFDEIYILNYIAKCDKCKAEYGVPVLRKEYSEMNKMLQEQINEDKKKHNHLMRANNRKYKLKKALQEEKNHNVICKCGNVTDIEMSEKKNNYGANVVKFIANCSKCKKVYRAGFILENGECIETSINKINKAIQEYIRVIYK